MSDTLFLLNLAMPVLLIVRILAAWRERRRLTAERDEALFRVESLIAEGDNLRRLIAVQRATLREERATRPKRVEHSLNCAGNAGCCATRTFADGPVPARP